jgi:hypothetical protein
VTKVYFGSISVNESKDLKIILGTGKEEAKDGQGKALEMKTINKVRKSFSPSKNTF